jgi:hypothetical protein
MPLWAKRKSQLMKGSLVRLPLCRTRRHQTDSLSLHFHMTSVMMPRAPPIIAPSPVLRQNWETLDRVASRRSKTPYVDSCPHTVFIRSSVLRRKPTNHMVLMPKPRNCRSDFEAQITKPSTLVLSSKPRNRRSGFEVKPLTNYPHPF